MPGNDEKERIGTILPKRLITELKHLAVERRCRLNVLLEEALRDLLKKYEENPKK